MKYKLKYLPAFLAYCVISMSIFAEASIALYDSMTADQQSSDSKATVYIFTAPDCPIANRFSPYIRSLESEYSSKGIRFFLVYSNPKITEQKVNIHRKDYHLDIPAILDVDRDFARTAGASVTPECVVYVPSNNGQSRLVYRGRISNLYEDFGKWRHAHTEENLKSILDQILKGVAVPFSSTKAIGCYIF